MTKLDKKFILDFEGSEYLEECYSNLGQDIFVISLLNGIRDKTFLDLGCPYISEKNNTYILEKNYNWNGIVFDENREKLIIATKNRKCVGLIADSCKYNFTEVLKKPSGNFVDYMSINLDSCKNTVETLKKFPFDKVSFSVITVTHNIKNNNKLKSKSREILEKNGYYLLCEDATLNNSFFDDWYYNPKTVDPKRAKLYQSSKKDWQDILFKNEKREIKNNEKIDLGDVII